VDEEAQHGAPKAPRLAAVSTGTLLVTPLRAALGGAILGGTIAEGLPRAGVLLAVGVGAVLMAFGGASTRRIRSFDDFPEAPRSATFGRWWESGARAALPSTVGLSILGAVALGFSRGLAGVCGGLLVAMAILGAASGIVLLLEERRERRRLYVDWGILQPRRYVSPPAA
jgi:hypothetical protein